MIRARLAVLIAGAMIAAAMGVPRLEGANAGAEACNPSGACVLLIEVDGLEAKDVTPQTTPFLWALGHSGRNVAANTNLSPVAIGAAQVPGIATRNGFIWQAARGVMSASTAASTVSLLTGGYPSQTDVPADNYIADGSRVELGGNAGDENVGAAGAHTSADTLFGLMKDAEDDPSSSAGLGAAIVGDPRLKPIFGNVDTAAGGQVDAGRFWAPGTSDSVPAYCSIPQDSAEAAAQGQNISTQTCPTPDANTVRNAGDILTGANGAKVSFAYVELAELGAVKRLYGDVDDSTVPAQQNASTAVGAQHVASQLIATDAAIGSLVARVANQGDTAKWAKTVVMVVGNHGYETTPLTHRVPDPQDENNPGMGLEDYVANVSGGSASFVPDGNVGFVYAPSDKSKLGTIADDLKPGGAVDHTRLCSAGGQANAADALTVGSGCIQEVLATGAVDAQGHSTIPGVYSVQDKHPDWHLHYVDPKDGTPSGTDGDLMVVLKPGWAAGELVPLKSTGGVPNPVTAYQGGQNGGSIENPYMGSPGGPRNRAIAAIINGPQSVVRQVDTDGMYPVADGPLDEGACPTASQIRASGTDPNANPADDAVAQGHECQAETVDFAPTIGALLHVGVPFTQLGGRFLQEAFKITLGLPQEEEVEAAPPDDALPPPLEPDIRIPPPPPPPKGFDFFGLLRGVSARAVDQNGCTWETAPAGAHMDYLRIEGDFGRQLSSAQLTFYQRKQTAPVKHEAKAQARHGKAHAAAAKSKCVGAKRKSGSAHASSAPKRPPLRAIARFKPFALKRGHVVLRLRIPDLYRPSHIGIFVQEARKLKVPKVGPDGQPGPAFVGFGPAAGEIVSIADARHMHAVKPGGHHRPAKKGKRKRG